MTRFRMKDVDLARNMLRVGVRPRGFMNMVRRIFNVKELPAKASWLYHCFVWVVGETLYVAGINTAKIEFYKITWFTGKFNTVDWVLSMKKDKELVDGPCMKFENINGFMDWVKTHECTSTLVKTLND